MVKHFTEGTSHASPSRLLSVVDMLAQCIADEINCAPIDGIQTLVHKERNAPRPVYPLRRLCSAFFLSQESGIIIEERAEVEHDER